MMLLSTTLALGAAASPLVPHQPTARELLDAQHNSSGFPFSPNYPPSQPGDQSNQLENHPPMLVWIGIRGVIANPLIVQGRT
jgi:hypothetical protein